MSSESDRSREGVGDSELHRRLTRAADSQSGSSSPKKDLGGLELGGYRLEEELGRGGMGTVFRATQISLGRPVAVKVLPKELSDQDQMVVRFKREIQMLTALSHPNIVAILDGGFDDNHGLYYSVMELVDGVTLRQVIDSGDLQPKEALKLVPSICDALEYAHGKGVLHRDIKPANILLDREGRVKIADFGLSRLMGDSNETARITKTQQVMGTVEYMAPEQREGAKNIDHRADIYSLGVVFYEMLTGELPIGRFDPPSRKVEIDVRLDDVVLRVLQKDPDRRYQRASAVAVDVRSLEEAGPSVGPDVPRDQSPRHPGDRRNQPKGKPMDGASVLEVPARTSGWAIASFVMTLVTLLPLLLGIALFLVWSVRGGR